MDKYKSLIENSCKWPVDGKFEDATDDILKKLDIEEDDNEELEMNKKQDKPDLLIIIIN